MSDIYLLSTERNFDEFKGLFKDKKSVSIFFVNNGAWPLEGQRFENVYVDYMCCKHPNFEECIELILRSKTMMKEPVTIYLI